MSGELDENEMKQDLLNKETGTSKKSLIIILSLTVGIILLIILILIFISMNNNDSDKPNKTDITNTISLKYKSKKNVEIQLFNSKYINSISSISPFSISQNLAASLDTVVFPPPEGPISAVTSPCLATKLTSFRTVSPSS